MTQRLLIVVGGILVFLVGAWLLWGKLFAQETTTLAPPPDAAQRIAQQIPGTDAEPEPILPAVRLTSGEGTIEVEQPDGQWRPLAAGEELALGDRVRTGEGSSATINVSGTVLEIGENGSLTIPELRRVDIGDGQITATVEKSDEAFVVGTEGSDATAASTEGEFAVISDGEGGVAVASKVGNTVFQKSGESVELPEGTVSRASADSGPSTPQAIPTSLFLKVAGPRRTIKTKRFTLRGESSPGTIIRVNGESVRVGEDGTFQHVVALREGQNDVLVDSRDVLGRRKAESVVVEVDSKGPAIEGKVTW